MLEPIITVGGGRIARPIVGETKVDWMARQAELNKEQSDGWHARTEQVPQPPSTKLDKLGLLGRAINNVKEISDHIGSWLGADPCAKEKEEKAQWDACYATGMCT